MVEDKDKLFYKFRRLEFKVATKDESWFYPEEPHAARRKEILEKYPQIKKLMGNKTPIAYIVGVQVLIQIFACWIVQDVNWTFLFVLAYCFGATVSHSLHAAMHEISHNSAFGHNRPTFNRLLMIWCNLPLLYPFSMKFLKEHRLHHKNLGDDGTDPQVPLHIETYLFRNPFTKIIWLILHLPIFLIRGATKRKAPAGKWVHANKVLQYSFDFGILYLFGLKSLVYLLSSSVLFAGIHPLVARQISYHYLSDRGQPTHSYYGPLNIILFNSGYHNEHHDFPNIPYTRLPEVKKIAAEYYNDLPHHTSFLKNIWNFVFDKNLGVQARAVGYFREDVKLE